MRIVKPIGILLIALMLAWIAGPARAQTGMNKATAKLLVGDLIEAGFAPQIRESNGVFVITVAAEPAQAGTAAQVNAFATNRGVAARVLVVQFE